MATRWWPTSGSAARSRANESDEALTETGVSVGTPAYMSPEQATGQPVDARTDVYALGAVLYEMLAGEPPFTGPTPQAVIAKRFHTDAVPLRAVRPAVPEHVERAVARALARVPADRFASTAELARALEGDATTAAPVTAPREPCAPPAARGVLLLALGVLLGLGVLFGWSRSRRAAPAERRWAPARGGAAVRQSGDGGQGLLRGGDHRRDPRQARHRARPPGDRADQLGAVRPEHQAAGGDRPGARGRVPA